MSDLLGTVSVVDGTQIALIVAGITGGAAIVQGSVQAHLTARSARVAARQQAIQAEIALLQRLQGQLADMGQACNDYGLEVFEVAFYTDDGWATTRRPLLQRLITTQGHVFSTAHALAPTSAARAAVLGAADVAVALGAHGEPKKINESWRQILTRSASPSKPLAPNLGTSMDALRTQHVTGSHEQSAELDSPSVDGSAATGQRYVRATCGACAPRLKRERSLSAMRLATEL